MTALLTQDNRGCLLVIDDQESNIQVIGAALGQFGFEILPATGLGWSIVKRLVLAMHGELACESTPGHGATLAFRLPRAAAAR